MSLALLDEWPGVRTVSGVDALCKAGGRVGRGWLSGCTEERALTEGLMARMVGPSDLVAALRQVVSNKGSAGVDGMTAKELQSRFSGHHRQLQGGAPRAPAKYRQCVRWRCPNPMVEYGPWACPR